MTYEEAKEQANKLVDDVNVCNEYKDAYHFFNESKEEKDGGYGVVIIKETGKAISWINFIMDYKPETNPKRIEVK